MQGSQFKGRSGTTYSVARELGSGGEGTVYTVAGNDSIVLKVYNTAPAFDKAAKLKYMVSMGNQRIQSYAAWPLDVVSDHTGHIVGFTMKKIREAVPLHKLFSPMDRKQLFPDKGYNFLIHVCRNLAAAFHTIHAAGLVVGDINEGNILVDNNGVINFIDCDSFQVNNNGRIYFCEVGVPRYTPPELLSLGTFENVVRTTNTDTFSMAILMFQLMFLGRHPFAGRILSNEDVDEETAIKKHYFFYSRSGRNKNLQPPPKSLTLDQMPDGLSNLFHRTFEQTDNRPATSEWLIHTDALLKQLVKCDKSNLHFYSQKSSACPWCEFREKHNTLFFLDNITQGSYVVNNINDFVQGFKIEKISVPRVDGAYQTPGLTAQSIDKKYLAFKKYSTAIKTFFVLSGIALAFLSPWFLLLVIGGLVVDELLPWKKPLKAELQSRTSNFNTLKSKLDLLVRDYNNQKDVSSYNAMAGNLAQLVDDFKNLPAEFRKRQQQIEEKLYNDQLHAFLRNYDIRNYSIPGFASGKKLMLYNGGIRNASDISKLPSARIRGIGPAGMQTLVSWQRQIMSRFSYSPDALLLNREINILASEIKQKKLDLESKIKREYTSLEYYKGNITGRQQTIKINIDNLKKLVCQAELDLNAFKKISSL